jgi:hypothetical protein
MAVAKIENKRIFCSMCKEYAQFLPISKAAQLVDVTPRTIYNYLDEGLINSIRVAGKARRVCCGCLVKEASEIK